MFPHVPDPGAPCTRPWNTLYQTLEHLVPDPGYLVPDPASTPRAGGRAKPGPLRVHSNPHITETRIWAPYNVIMCKCVDDWSGKPPPLTFWPSLCMYRSVSISPKKPVENLKS